MELTFEAGQWWSYLLVFVAAAVPVIEVLLVIPPAILSGMSPLLTGTHLATIAALTTGASIGAVLRWMTIGLLGWSFFVAGVTSAGLDLFT